MRAAVLVLGLGSIVAAGVAPSQVWVGTTTRDTSAADSSTSYRAVGSNANALELMELLGVRKRFEIDRGKGMAEAKQELLHEYPFLTPTFLNEWAKRVTERLNPDDYVAIAAGVYASHFTDDELGELVQGQRNVNAGRQSGLPQPLRDKLRRVLPTLAGEIAAGYARTGATLGAEVAEQVAKEHPEWLRRPAAAPSASR